LTGHFWTHDSMIRSFNTYTFLVLPFFSLTASTVNASLSIKDSVTSRNSLFFIWEAFINWEWLALPLYLFRNDVVGPRLYVGLFLSTN